MEVSNYIICIMKKNIRGSDTNGRPVVLYAKRGRNDKANNIGVLNLIDPPIMIEKMRLGPQLKELI